MRIDNLPEPKHYWYEDRDGNEIPWDIHGAGNPFPEEYDDGKVYQNSISLLVTHSICVRHKSPAWPVRILKWMIERMPNKWRGNSSEIFRGNSTVNASYDLIKHLIERRNFSLEQSSIIASDLCSNCYDIIMWEEQGNDLEDMDQSNHKINMYCEHCKHINPDFAERHRVWCCYRTLKLGGDIAKAWNKITIDSAPGYWGLEDAKISRIKKIINFFKRKLR